MKQIRYFIIILILSCYSCIDLPLFSTLDDEMEVINTAFFDMIGNEFYYEPLPPPPFPLQFRATPEDTLAYFEELDIIREKMNNRDLDPARLVIIISDTLYPLDDIRWKIPNNLNSDNSFGISYSVQEPFISLMNQLSDSTYSKRIYNIDDISKRGKYLLITENEESNLNTAPKQGFRKVGYAGFSRVSFNEAKNKACFYYYFICGQQCGFGTYVFLEKKNNKWQILGEQQMWVS